MYPFLKSLENKAPLCRFLKGPVWREVATPRAFFKVSFSIPSKAAFSSGSCPRAPMERDASFREPYICFLKPSVKQAPFQVPQWGPPIEREPVSRAFFYISLGFPSKQSHLINYSSQSPW
jgi:hypothetical protein